MAVLKYKHDKRSNEYNVWWCLHISTILSTCQQQI
nr:MAG TPA: hypothetical protein [Caudoviricetes sp.]